MKLPLHLRSLPASIHCPASGPLNHADEAASGPSPGGPASSGGRAGGPPFWVIVGAVVLADALAIAVALGLTGCSSLSPATQTKLDQTASYAEQKTLAVAEQFLVNYAVSSVDRSAKAGNVQGLSTALRSAEGSLLTSNDVANLVAIWTAKAPTPATQWAALGSQIAAVYASANPKTPQEAQAVLEAISNGLSQAQ